MTYFYEKLQKHFLLDLQNNCSIDIVFVINGTISSLVILFQMRFNGCLPEGA